MLGNHCGRQYCDYKAVKTTKLAELLGVVALAVIIGAVVELVVTVVWRLLVLPAAVLVAPLLRVVALRPLVVVLFFRLVFFIKVVLREGLYFRERP